ncbi:MAG: hypothetical protein SFU86_04800 [Pirellulaceae bacterium]|nr:hypothetical protein [Pirellulaceae bacterium]
MANNIRRRDRALWIGLGRLPDPKVDLPTIVVEFVSPGRRNFLRDYSPLLPGFELPVGRLLATANR